MYPYNIEYQKDEALSSPDKNYQEIDKTKAQNTPPSHQYPLPPPKPHPHPHPQPQPHPHPHPYPVKPDERLMRMLEVGIKEEQKIAEYYLRLMQMFRHPDDVELIRHMRMDSLKHIKILEELYSNVSGRKGAIKITHAEPNEAEIILTQNLSDNLSRDILNTINSCDYYRKLYVSFLNIEIRDMLYEIVCDKHNHAIKLTYLFSKHK